jgi:pimeloyl-ACP methyl ester carboxylesterase
MTLYPVARPARSTFLPIRFHRYHVLEWGRADSPNPPLVLTHGWMDIGASYQFLVDAFSAEFLADRRVIAPDWRGFGQTTGPACDHYAFPDYLGDLDALLAHYAPDRPVDLVGHSMGGNVVMMYAGTRTGRIHRLVNLEGFGSPATRPEQAPKRYAQWLDEIGALARGEKELQTYTDVSRVAARLRKTNPRLPEDKAEWLARQWAEARPQADGSTHWVIRGAAAHRVVSAQLFRVDEMLALYAAITAPTLMVVASDNQMAHWWQGRYTLDEFDQRIKAVRDLRMERLAGCGHMLHHDQPEALARLMESFLTES